MPERSRSSTFSTPACPLAPRPHRYARPIITAFAPRASAFTTSPPRRTPPSSSTATWSPTAWAMPGSIRTVAGVPSRLLPPWLDTEIAETPASTARLASSILVTPLSMNAPCPWDRSQATCSQAGAVPGCARHQNRALPLGPQPGDVLPGRRRRSHPLPVGAEERRRGRTADRQVRHGEIGDRARAEPLIQVGGPRASPGELAVQILRRHFHP